MNFVKLLISAVGLGLTLGNPIFTEAAVTGGTDNTATGVNSAVAGGEDNKATGKNSFIGGGFRNQATNELSTVIGGYDNVAGDSYSTIVGGQDNRTSSMWASVFGGTSNSAGGNNSVTVGGNHNVTLSLASVAIGGENNYVQANFAMNVGGWQNWVLAEHSVNSGGYSNYTYGKYSLTGGGGDNKATSERSTSIGGEYNISGGYASLSSGGYQNYVGGMRATALGGTQAIVRGEYATGVGGGSTNANYAIAVGYQSVSTTENGLALGYQAVQNAEGTISFGHEVGDISKYTYKIPNNDKGKPDYTGTTTYTESIYDTAYYNRLVKVADGIDDHDVTTVGQVKKMVAKAGGGASYTGEGDITISSDNKISVTKSGLIKSGNTGIVTGDTVYKVTNALANNLTSQQSMITSNTSTITTLQSTISNLKNSIANINSNVMSATKSISSSMTNRMQSDMGNLTEDGKAVIRDLIKETLKSSTYSASVGVDQGYIASPVSTYQAPVVEADTSSSTVTSKDIEDIHNEIGNKVDKTDFSALKDTVTSNTDKITKNTESIGANTADIADLKENKANVDGSNIDVTKFTEKLGVGEIAQDNGGLVTGGTVFTALEQKADYDYVNAGFGAMQNQMDSMQHRLTQDINRVGAGAAALAGLHPQDYDSDNKLDFATGYGHYKNANATALGIFYRPNAGTTVSLSGTIGNGDPMISAGLSFKLGMGKNVEKVIITKEKYEAMQARDDQMEERIKELEDALRTMKAK